MPNIKVSALPAPFPWLSVKITKNVMVSGLVSLVHIPYFRKFPTFFSLSARFHVNDFSGHATLRCPWKNLFESKSSLFTLVS